jgi:predicted HicB family RNase H-like nuclease
MMEYKGYIGKVEFDDEAGVFHGEVINTRDVITFQGESVVKLRRAFVDSVRDYLAFCEERGEEPDKPFSGQFMTRIPPDLHRRVNLAATLANRSLNAWVSEQLEQAAARAGLGSTKRETAEMETYEFTATIAERWGGKTPQVQIVPDDPQAYLAWRERVGLGGNVTWNGPQLHVTVSGASFVARCQGTNRVRYKVRRAGSQMRGVNLQPI